MDKQSDYTEKQKGWKELSRRVDQVVDGLGKPIDLEIKETIIALNANGFNTASSCGGHIEKRLLFPYVHIQPADKPRYRHETEELLVGNILKKYQLKEWIDIVHSNEAYDEYAEGIKNLPYTSAYSAWLITEKEFEEKLETLLKEYREVRIDSPFHRVPVHGTYRLEALSAVRNESEITRCQRIKISQNEFYNLAEFLKQRYFQS